MKSLLKRVLPKSAREHLRTGRRKLLARTLTLHAMALRGTLRYLDGNDVLPIFNAYGLNLSQVSDYYSPLPVVSALKNNRQRWARPSEMVGVRYDLEAMKQLLQGLCACYTDELRQLPSYDEARKIGYGPGYPSIDAMILYFMLRKIKPSRYIEIGSGLSTWYCSMAAEKNAKEGKPLQIKCIDPFPSTKLCSTPGIDVLAKQVQDVDVDVFSELHAGDVLFIDSTHVVKIDGDVPYLYLEVLPRLKKGVVIHVHDIHFPFNIPYPPECYIFGGWKWPMFWTEAMLLQAFLCNNNAFRILLSAPLLYYYSEDFLQASIPNYRSVDPAHTNTHFGSIWIEKVDD
jgi:hypothetical protein